MPQKCGKGCCQAQHACISSWGQGSCRGSRLGTYGAPSFYYYAASQKYCAPTGVGGGGPPAPCKCPRDFYVRDGKCCPTRWNGSCIPCQGGTGTWSSGPPSPAGGCPPGEACLTIAECAQALSTAGQSCGPGRVCCSTRRQAGRSAPPAPTFG